MDSNPAEASIKTELVAGSDSLYFIFGGIQGGLGMPPFEFVKASGTLASSRVFIRDMGQCWYQRGLPELGQDMEGIRDFLARTIDQSKASRIIFVGNSMGGYAALLFCAMLKCGRAVGFSPQTFISADLRKIHGDGRWEKQLERIHRQPKITDVCDLREYIIRQYRDIKADIYVSKADRLDLLHAEMLSGFQNVCIHRFESGGHGLVRQLRDTGMLEKILSNG